MFLRKYGVAAQVDGIPLITRGAVDYKANPTLASGDVQISKDGDAFANIEGVGTFSNFVAVAPASSTSVQVKPDATAMQCKTLVIRFIDQTATKEWEDQEIIIQTFGHASALFTGDLNNMDYSVASTRTDLTASIAAVKALLNGTGDTAVDHNTGGADNLRVTTSGGVGVDNVTIKAYLKSDYDAGNNGDTYIQGRGITKADGRWTYPIYLDAGSTYKIVFYKQGEYKVTTAEVTI